MNRKAHRRIGWEKCFAAAMARAQSRDFEFGRFDCCIFAADVVNAITGVDLADRLRGTYSDKAGALEVINARGGLEALLDGICTAGGLVPVPIVNAKRGDVVLLPASGDWPGTAGVCLGPLVAAPGLRRGLSYAPLSTAVRCWSIPHASCRN